MVSSWEPWKWLSTTRTCFPGNLSRERHFYNWRQYFCPTLIITAFPLFQFCFSFVIYSQHSSPDGKFESFTWSHKNGRHFSHYFFPATPLISSFLLSVPYSHTGGELLTHLWRHPQLASGSRFSSQALTLPSSLLSHPLCTPSRPHHMLPDLLSWDTGFAPTGPSASLSPPGIMPVPAVCPSPAAGPNLQPLSSLASALHTPAGTQWSPVPHQGRGLPAKKNIQGDRGSMVSGVSVGSRVRSTCFLPALWAPANLLTRYQLPGEKHSTCRLAFLWSWPYCSSCWWVLCLSGLVLQLFVARPPGGRGLTYLYPLESGMKTSLPALSSRSVNAGHVSFWTS